MTTATAPAEGPAQSPAAGTVAGVGPKRVHLVYPHRNGISTPDAIGWQLGQRLESRYTVVYHEWSDRDVIDPEPGDVLLGHPHPDPNTVFRRSLERPGWSRRLLMAPFNHGDLRQVAFEDRLIRHCDLYLAITGPYWFNTLAESACSHWRPKMVHLDLAIDRSHFPVVKTSFAPPGQRRAVYIGNTHRYKNTPYLSRIAALVPEADIAWIGHGVRGIRGVRALGRIDFGSPAGKDLVSGFDFLLTVGKADCNPTTILEAMAWGLIPVCTPTSGYDGIPGIPNVPANDPRAASVILRRLLQADESELRAMQASNWRALEEHYNWDRFAAQVVDAIEAADSPPLLTESRPRRLLFSFNDHTAPYGRAGRAASRVDLLSRQTVRALRSRLRPSH